MYFTDRGIEELEDRRGEESATFAAIAEHMRQFVDLNPEHEIPIDRLATWLARLDDVTMTDKRAAPLAWHFH